MRRRLKIPVRGLFLVMFMIAAWGGANAAPPDLSLPALTTAPVLDGTLAHDEWKDAVRVELAFQVEPGNNSPASEKTEAFLARDRERLYIAFRAHDTDPAALRARVVRRDEVSSEDYVTVILDTYNDHQRGYLLSFNPLGIQSDGFIDRTDDVDRTWDGLFESKGRVTTEGYEIEIAIPFKTLRFASGKDALWGLHLRRWIARKSERTSWKPLSRDVSSLLVQTGTLSGFEDVAVGRTLDVTPTVTGSFNRERRPDDRLAAFRKLEAGLTVTFSPTPNLTVTATANPDFSQVEADTPQVNVNQRFILFFPERRPFFLEGAEFFRSLAVNEGSGLSLFNSRTVVDPDWGIKLTGKIGRTSFGALSASDRSAGRRVAFGERGSGENARFNVVRVQRDFLKDSGLGLFFTDTRFAGAANTVGAVDGRLRVRSDTTVSGQFTQTFTKENDGTRADGRSFTLKYNQYGRNWRIFADHQQVDPAYRNDAGFVDRTGYRGTSGEIGYEFRPENDKTWYSGIWPYVFAYRSTRADGTPELQNVNAAVDVNFRRGASLVFVASANRDGFAGIVRSYRNQSVRYVLNTFKKFEANGSVTFGEGLNLDPGNVRVGRLLAMRHELVLRPSQALDLQFLYLKSRLSDPVTGRPFFNQHIFRNRTNFQFTRNTAFRMLVDYDTAARRFGASLLFSYTPRPNTAFFLGYNDLLFNGLNPVPDRRTGGVFRQSQTFFFKISRNFRF